MVRGKLVPAGNSGDQRREADVRAENERLKGAIVNLQAQLDAALTTLAERGKMKDVGDLCLPMTVVGSDSGTRQSLNLSVDPHANIKEKMAVLYPGGLAGRISRASAAGAQVQLVTDRGFKAFGFFGRFVSDKDGQLELQHLPTEPLLIEGTGKAMVVRNLNLKEAQAVLHDGDLAILDDPDYPQRLAKQRLGKIVAIKARPDAPLKAEIRIEPMQNLMELREVMVVTRN